MIENEKLFEDIYHRTQDFGRVHFVREIQRLMIENKDLKQDIKVLFEENHNKEEVINKYQVSWNKLKEYCQLNIDKPNIKFMLEIMQELEKGE